MSNRAYFEQLLEKYKAGSCTLKEYHTLVELLTEHPDWMTSITDAVDQDWKTTFVLPRTKRNQWRRKRRTFAIAASFGLLIIAIIFTRGLWQPEDTLVFETDYGEIQEIELPDGSQLTLNANSKLIWQTNWEAKDRRSAELFGEAYFDIAHLPGSGETGRMPFTVSASDVEINVLGTAFNVEARRGEAKIFLERGEVVLKIDPQLKVEREEIKMKPGDQITYNGLTQQMERKNDPSGSYATAWKTGVINFQNEKLANILVKLSDIFGVEFTCDEELKERPMDVGLPYLDWAAMKESLELSIGVSIVELDGKYHVQQK